MICGLFMAFLTVSLGSCKKNDGPNESIVGIWKEPASPTGYVRSVVFKSDGTFLASFNYYAPDPSNNTTIEFDGRYSVKGDSLITGVTKIADKNKDGTTYPAVQPANHPLYEFATFRVNTNVLTINYTTYPADAPVATEVKFNRFTN
ncbi:hypothetical protein BC343_01150 [Mucilaginibacter pedocola]|uniref:Lipocalin-like domain-containing protein n=2 Tax=Mucilaginibacter pedocola TaxID=1792845 RepID=A0A1S9PL69_9SPHI|nr:hypothetical protein BC343_01150 [Mucilaginibacter pedocola]